MCLFVVILTGFGTLVAPVAIGKSSRRSSRSLLVLQRKIMMTGHAIRWHGTFGARPPVPGGILGYCAWGNNVQTVVLNELQGPFGTAVQHPGFAVFSSSIHNLDSDTERNQRRERAMKDTDQTSTSTNDYIFTAWRIIARSM